MKLLCQEIHGTLEFEAFISGLIQSCIETCGFWSSIHSEFSESARL